jgi:predicted nucleic acid-binding Zn ribbon protein
MPNDKARPEPIAGALNRFLQQRGFAGRIEQGRVLTAWPTLVGPEIAAVTQTLSISAEGVLFVAVKSHPWMSELSLMERELLDAINQSTPAAPIRQIRFQLAR